MNALFLISWGLASLSLMALVVRIIISIYRIERHERSLEQMRKDIKAKP